MKKLLTLMMLISFAMICSCQKQGSTAEQQLAQRKAELDAREKALDEREKALAERENPTASASAVPSGLHLRDKTRDPEEVKADIENRLQQLPPDARRLIPDESRMQEMREAREEKERITQQDKLARRQRRQEERQATRAQMQNQDAKSGAKQAAKQLGSTRIDAENAMSAPTAYPQSGATSPPQLEPLSVYPQAEATSPSPSPTPPPSPTPQ